MEALLTGVALAGSWLLGRERRRWIAWGYLALAAASVGAEFSDEGLPWQMTLIGGILVVNAVLLFMAPLRFVRARWLLFGDLALCVASWGLLYVLPVFRLPRPTGGYGVGTQVVHWTDQTRGLDGERGGTGQRELAVQIWYPAGLEGHGAEGLRARYVRRKEVGLASSYMAGIRTNSYEDAPIAGSGGPFPVLIFGHRWGGRRTQNTVLAEELASHGYVVVSIDHPLNTARMERSDGSVVRSDRAAALGDLEGSSAAAIRALWAKELEIWVADDRFVLDKMLANNDGWFAGRLDEQRIGAFGHSFGGAAALALLGADVRVKCAVNLDGWTFNGLAQRTSEPVLMVYEAAAQVRRPETGVEGELDRYDNDSVDTSLRQFGGLRAYVAGTQHLDFTDQTLLSPWQRISYTGPIAGARIRTITNGLVLGFFDRELRGAGEVPMFPEVTLERWPPPPKSMQSPDK